MRSTGIRNYDAVALWNKLAVTDQELAFMLSCGLPTARRVAIEANAVFRIGKLKRNNVSKIKAYTDAISGE